MGKRITNFTCIIYILLIIITFAYWAAVYGFNEVFRNFTDGLILFLMCIEFVPTLILMLNEDN